MGGCSFRPRWCFLSPAAIPGKLLMETWNNHVKATGRYRKGWFKVWDQSKMAQKPRVLSLVGATRLLIFDMLI